LRIYTLVYDDYRDAFRALRKLRKRRVSLCYAIFVVKTERHNRIIDLISQQKNNGLKASLIIVK